MFFFLTFAEVFGGTWDDFGGLESILASWMASGRWLAGRLACWLGSMDAPDLRGCGQEVVKLCPGVYWGSLGCPDLRGCDQEVVKLSALGPTINQSDCLPASTNATGTEQSTSKTLDSRIATSTDWWSTSGRRIQHAYISIGADIVQLYRCPTSLLITYRYIRKYVTSIKISERYTNILQ